MCVYVFICECVREGKASKPWKHGFLSSLCVCGRALVTSAAMIGESDLYRQTHTQSYTHPAQIMGPLSSSAPTLTGYMKVKIRLINFSLQFVLLCADILIPKKCVHHNYNLDFGMSS